MKINTGITKNEKYEIPINNQCIWQLTVTVGNKTKVVEYPLTIDFNITRNTSTNTVGDGTKTLIAGGSAISNKTLPTITAAAGDRMPVVVMPTSARKKVASASMPSSLNAPVTFTKLGTVNLEGYNGASAVSYDVWGYVADDMPVGADFSIVIANA